MSASRLLRNIALTTALCTGVVGCSTFGTVRGGVSDDVQHVYGVDMHNMPDSPRAEELNISDDPNMIEYAPYSVIYGAQLHALVVNASKDIFFELTAEVSPDLPEAEIEKRYNAKMKPSEFKLFVTMAAKSAKPLAWNAIDFEVAEAKYAEIIVSGFGAGSDVVFTEKVTDLAARYRSEFPDVQPHQFAVKDLSVLPDMSTRKNFPSVDDDMELAASDYYPEMLDMWVNLTKEISPVNSSVFGIEVGIYREDDPVPPLFIREGGGYGAGYISDADSVRVEEGLVQDFGPNIVRQVLLHEISHRRNRFDVVGLTPSEAIDSIFGDWQSACSSCNTDKIFSPIYEAASESSPDERIRNMLVTHGKTADEVRKSLDFVSESCRNAVVDVLVGVSDGLKAGEFRADRFAVEHEVGGGKFLAEYFSILQTITNPSHLIGIGEIYVHPSHEERITSIREQVEARDNETGRGR